MIDFSVFNPEANIDVNDVLRTLNVSRRTLDRYIASNLFPQGFKQGNKLLWRVKDILRHYDKLARISQYQAKVKHA